MSVSAELLAVLACPSCHAELRLARGPERLVCAGCGLQYPIRDGIPVLLIDEAAPPAPPPA